MLFFPAYIESTFLFAAIVLMDTSNKEQITAGLFMANAFADISNGPASGTYRIPISNDPAGGMYKIYISNDPASGTYKIYISNDPASGTYKIHISNGPASGTYTIYRHVNDS